MLGYLAVGSFGAAALAWIWKETHEIRRLRLGWVQRGENLRLPTASDDDGDFVALVTGGNRGIGKEIVRVLAQALGPSQAGRVILCCRSKEQGERVVAEMEGPDKQGLAGCDVRVEALDVTDPRSVAALVAALEVKYGKLDCLVNNAGFAFKMNDKTPFAEQAKYTTAVNYFGLKRVTQALLPLLEKSKVAGGSRVVTVSSTAGQIGGSTKVSDAVKARFLDDGLTVEQLDGIVSEFVAAAQENRHKEAGFSGSAYATSKTAATQLMRVLQKEYDRPPPSPAEALPLPTTFVSSCPGLCRTDMAGGSKKKEHRTLLSFVFWLVTWLVGRSARAGADTPAWLALEVDWASSEAQEGRGKFFRGRTLRAF